MLLNQKLMEFAREAESKRQPNKPYHPVGVLRYRWRSRAQLTRESLANGVGDGVFDGEGTSCYMIRTECQITRLGRVRWYRRENGKLETGTVPYKLAAFEGAVNETG